MKIFNSFDINHDGKLSYLELKKGLVQMYGENLSEIDFEEQDLLDREALTESYHRLGCQARVSGDG